MCLDDVFVRKVLTGQSLGGCTYMENNSVTLIIISFLLISCLSKQHNSLVISGRVGILCNYYIFNEGACT